MDEVRYDDAEVLRPKKFDLRDSKVLRPTTLIAEIYPKRVRKLRRRKRQFDAGVFNWCCVISVVLKVR